jgi:hypothetical protein
VLDEAVQQATVWVLTTTEKQLSALQLSEWVHEIITKSVQPPIDELRKTGRSAIHSLQKIAKEMGRSDAPSLEDFEALLRDLPRFELAALPAAINAGHWRVWGEAVLRSRIRSGLRQSIGLHLKEDLHLYGMALSRWSEQVVRKLEALVNSYTDAYRVQLHRMSGASAKAVNLEQLEADLEQLQRWNVEAASDLKAESA